MPSVDFGNFLKAHLARVEPLAREVNLAYWSASVSGAKRDFDRSAELQVELQRIYADRDDFAKIAAWQEGSSVTDPLERRQLELLYFAYLRNQIDPALNERMTLLASEIENQFNVYRATIDGRSATSNDILRILKESNDSDLRRKAWNASKEVGRIVEKDLITLVKLRNEAASSLGYRNYYAMSLELNEQSETEIALIFDGLDEHTRGTFADLKHEVDTKLAARFGIGTADIRPWHYEDPFFQEAPQVYDIDLDRFYADHDVVDLVTQYYDSVGLDVRDILARSDLYEKPGKDQHAFCTDIDRNGDIRILCNVKNDETWTGTLLHELGHAVHDKYIDPSLPYLLRQEAHIFTTEAIAMLFGRLSKDTDWIQQTVGMKETERTAVAGNLAKSLRLQQLIFSRWSQVMMRFERGMYLDPDRDLNALWWKLANRYQMLAPPDEPDFPHWASKTHIVSVPVYYHNYLLGELLASQLYSYLGDHVLPRAGEGKPLTGPEVGEFLTKRVFRPGARYRWDEMIRQATGQELSPEYFVGEFVQGD